MPKRSMVLSSGGLGAALSTTLLLAPALLAPSPGQAQVVYTLATQCSVKGGAPVPCSVEALQEGKVTLYRHRIGSTIETIRISEAPVRMELWNGSTKQWNSLSTAAARFSSNTICFNGRDLCVINPNYLNSVREDNPAAMARRDLVKVHFGADGRINASCYDNGCEVNLK
jgi:hypothetical protein